MIPSLITYNYSIITYTTPSVQNAAIQLKDWLPLLVSVLVVIIGAFLTYDRNITIEEKKRQYELKKQTYFELLDVNLDAIKAWSSTGGNENLVSNPVIFAQINSVSYKFQSAIYKLQLCDAPTEIKDIVERLSKPEVLRDRMGAHNIVMNELVPAVKKDLTKIEISWWQFWRKD